MRLPMLAKMAVLAAAAPMFAQVPRDRCDEMGTDARERFPYRDLPVDTVRQTLHPTSTFTAEGTIYCDITPDYQAPFRSPLRFVQSERGAHGKFAYRIWYSDGSGSIRRLEDADDLLASELWSLSCKVDAMTDAKSCMLSRRDLYLHYRGDSEWSVHVGANNYPGRAVSIRIGDNPAQSSREPGFSGVQARQLVEQLMEEPRVRTRYFRWPSGIPEQDFVAEGFRTAVDLVMWTFEHMQAR